MKKRICNFILICILCANLFAANTYAHLECNFKYQWHPGQDSALKVRLLFHGLPTAMTDSFNLTGNTHFEKNYQFSYDWDLQYLEIIFIKPNGTLLGSYIPKYSFNSGICSGYWVSQPFGGNSCVDFSTNMAGLVCGDLNYNYVKDASSDHIKYDKGHWSDPFGIYCEYNPLDYEPPLILKAPCYFSYKNDSNSLSWFESADGGLSWKFLKKGSFIYPVLESYNGSVMYNIKRHYKVVVDTNWVKGIHGQFDSKIFGPVLFYLGKHIDSLEFKSVIQCNERSDLLVHYLADSNTNKLKAPRVWIFYKEHDTAQEKRWYLGVFSESNTALAGKKIIPEMGYPSPPDSVDLKPGIYRIRYDFAPWNGFNCKLLNKIIEIKESNTKHFNTSISIIDSLKCHGDANGRIRLRIGGDDTSNIAIVSEKQTYMGTDVYIDKLHSGLHFYTVANSRGCQIYDSVFLTNPAAFHHPMDFDTTICNGQTLNLNANHANAIKYLWKMDGDTIGQWDSIIISKKGIYSFTCYNNADCQSSDTFIVRNRDLDVYHDFLMPSLAKLVDTVYAVNISIPTPDSWSWKFHDSDVVSFTHKNFTLGATFPDSGYYKITVKSRFKECIYSLQKTILIVGEKDTNTSNENLGYKGPLIQSFIINPNPNDGYNFKLKIQLRDTSNILIYKIDAITGDIIGDVDLVNKKYYESTAFTSQVAEPGVFYLKLMAGSESKTIKVVVVK